MARIQFAVRMLLSRYRENHQRCPYCESVLHYRLQRKLVLIEARKCAFCNLIFRYPTDSTQEAQVFYERSYFGQQATGLPSEEELARLRAKNFANTRNDKSHRIQFLQSVCPRGRVLDFGCSWGYGVYQMERAGYQAVGYELARNRAEYGHQHLGVDIRSDWESLERDFTQSFDLIYADHSLEHVTNLRRPLEKFSRLLRPGGLLVIFVPNGGSLIGRRLGVRWKALLGETHTIAFTDAWFAQNLPRHGFTVESLFSSDLYDETLHDGEELVCVARVAPVFHQIQKEKYQSCVALSVE